MIYNPKSVVLEVIQAAAGLPGDYNQNGTVDAADYVVWRNTLGQTGTGLAADGNNNGQIDNDDYTFWRARFGTSLGVGSGSALPSAQPLSAAVPEPATFGLAGAGMLGCMACARWRRRR